MKKLALSLTCFVCFLSYAHAQRFIGVATGNEDMMNALYLNPANIGGCHEKFIISILSVNTSVDNNLGTIASAGTLLKNIKGNKPAAQSLFTFNGNTKFSMLAPMAEIRGPGIIFAINDQHSIAFTTRLRAFNQFYNFDKLLYNVVTQAGDQGSLNVNMKDFKWTVHLWSEAGFSYGGIIEDNEKYQVKIGVKINLLGGVGYFGLTGNNLDVKYIKGVDSFAANNADLQFSSNIYGVDNSVSSSLVLDNIFGGGGRGFGGDAGITYVSRKGNTPDDGDEPEHNYKFALSLSVTDIGSITYNEMSSTTFKGSGYVSPDGLSTNIKNYGNLNQYIASKGYQQSDSVKADLVYMPTSVLLGIDYHIKHKLFVNTLIAANIADDFHYGNKFFTQFTVAPRYDSKKFSLGMPVTYNTFSLGMPVTYNTLTQNIRVGLGARLGGFFMGSDDMLLFFMNHQYGFNFYCGAVVKIHRKAESE